MTGYWHKISLYSETDTQHLAKRVGQLLVPGDVIFLRGEIGAGKSFFARALIQSLQDIPEDVPSPTFTLVQTYITKIGEIWHADLYRLTASSEIDELGLLEAFESAITLVEWPEILSQISTEVLNGIPMPPYSSGTLIPRSPNSPAFFMHSSVNL